MINTHFNKIYSTKGYEILFFVFIDQKRERAFWLRQSILNRGTSLPGNNVSMVWAAYFDKRNPELHCNEIWQEVHDEKELGLSRSCIRLDGTKKINESSIEFISWDIVFQHNFPPINPVPRLFRNFNIFKSHSINCSPFFSAEGKINLRGSIISMKGTGSLNHLWGKERVHELYWIFVPAFDDQYSRYGIEIAFVRPKSWMPMITFAIIRDGQSVTEYSALPRLFKCSIDANFPKIQGKVTFSNLELEFTAIASFCQTVSYIYRNPDGEKFFIDQCDVSSVNCRLKKDQIVLNLSNQGSSAVEFHNMTPSQMSKPYLDGYKGYFNEP
jgi:hypothetical protein